MFGKTSGSSRMLSLGVLVSLALGTACADEQPARRRPADRNASLSPSPDKASPREGKDGKGKDGKGRKGSPRGKGEPREIDPGTAQINVTADEYSFDFPGTVEAGVTVFTLANAGQEKHHIQILELKDDAPSLTKLLESKQPRKFIVRRVGGTDEIDSGSERRFEAELTPGRYAYVCFLQAKKGKSHAELGMAGEFTID
ncbi:MAG: hypothetical protein ABR575_12015 [Actinomycetota bacterium]